MRRHLSIWVSEVSSTDLGVHSPGFGTLGTQKLGAELPIGRLVRSRTVSSDAIEGAAPNARTERRRGNGRGRAPNGMNVSVAGVELRGERSMVRRRGSCRDVVGSVQP